MEVISDYSDIYSLYSVEGELCDLLPEVWIRTQSPHSHKIKVYSNNLRRWSNE